MHTRETQAIYQTIAFAALAILGHRSAHSFPIGPVIADPFISPLGFTITPALSSKYMNTPSFLLQGFLCRTITAGITFFRRSGFPFFTVAMTMSPTHAAGSLLSLPFTPFTEITYKFLAPVLSAQFTTAPTGRPSDIRNLFPDDPPRPRFDMATRKIESHLLRYSEKAHEKKELGFHTKPYRRKKQNPNRDDVDMRMDANVHGVK
eukprot:c53325_g1_i1 orf=71-685(-)